MKKRRTKLRIDACLSDAKELEGNYNESSPAKKLNEKPDLNVQLGDNLQNLNMSLNLNQNSSPEKIGNKEMFAVNSNMTENFIFHNSHYNSSNDNEIEDDCCELTRSDGGDFPSQFGVCTPEHRL